MVGGGIASMAAAAFLIRDAGVPGENIGGWRGSSTTPTASIHVMGGAARCVTTGPPDRMLVTAAVARTSAGR
jgi:hypothetical protein